MESSGIVVFFVCVSVVSVVVVVCGMVDILSVVVMIGVIVVVGYDGVVGGIVFCMDKMGVERKVVELDKKLGLSSGNVEVVSLICEEKREEGFLVWEKKGMKSECVDVVGVVKLEVDLMWSMSVGVNVVIMKVEFERRYI